MKMHISSGGVVYKEQNKKIKYLVMYRKKTDSWHLPKGTKNYGENLKDTARREIKEETGQKVKLEKYIGKLESRYKKSGKNIEKNTHYFLAQITKEYKTPKRDSEHDKTCSLSYRTALRHLQHFSLYEKEGEILKMAERMLRQRVP